MTQDYLLCGWRVRSTLALPELPAWTGLERPVDITIAEGAVPERLDNPISPGRLSMVDAEGTILLTIPGLVRFLVRGGRSVRVEILHHEATQGWRLFLLGTVLGQLCHQRGLFPLHAATLRIGDRTVALAGHSGAGKSTLALALTRRGHRLLSDDVTVLETAPDRSGWVLPAFPRLKLWFDSCHAFGIDPEPLPRVRDALDKVDCSAHLHFDPAPGPLDGIVILDEGEALALAPLPPARAVTAILGYVTRPGFARRLGREPELFKQAALLGSRIRVARLTRPKRFDLLPAASAMIEDHFAS
jgi:hypothetical protein